MGWIAQLFGKNEAESAAPSELAYPLPLETVWKRLDRLFRENRTRYGDRWNLITRDDQEGRMLAEVVMKTVEQQDGSPAARFDAGMRMSRGQSGTTELTMTISLTVIFTAESNGTTKLSFAWGSNYKGLVHPNVPPKHFQAMQQDFYQQLAQTMK